MERTPNKSQHTKLTLEKKILPLLLPGFDLATFDHESGALQTSYSGLQGWIVGKGTRDIKTDGLEISKTLSDNLHTKTMQTLKH